MNLGNHSGRRQNFCHIPTIRCAHVHELNETKNHITAFEVFGHRNDLVIIGTFFNNHIDFDIFKANFTGCFNAIQYVTNRKTHIIHFLESRIVQTIKTDRHSGQASIFQSLCFFTQ